MSCLQYFHEFTMKTQSIREWMNCIMIACGIIASTRCSMESTRHVKICKKTLKVMQFVFRMNARKKKEEKKKTMHPRQIGVILVNNTLAHEPRTVLSWIWTMTEYVVLAFSQLNIWIFMMRLRFWHCLICIYLYTQTIHILFIAIRFRRDPTLYANTVQLEM